MTVTGPAPPARAIHRISGIIIGERRNRDLTGLDELMASITAHNLVHPLILTPDRHLVLGARRLEACRQLGWTDIPAMTVTGIWQALDCLETEHRDPRCLQPLTVAEAIGVDAALRELQWWPKEQPSYGAPATGRTVGHARRARIARLLGMNRGQYTQARELWQAADGYKEAFGKCTPIPRETQDHAAGLVARIRTAADIHDAYYRYREGIQVPRSTRGDGRRGPQRAQADQIGHGVASMKGTVAALMHIRSVDPSIPADQIAGWAEDITALIRDLSTVRRRLKKGQQ